MGNERKEQKGIYEGLINESLPNGMFGFCLDNEDPILGYVSERIRHRFIHILGQRESKLQ
uniref:Translation initiation factor 1 n=1 Tax=Cyclanthera pedata TaxID=198836 RepID=A0A8F1SS35_CYCPE|nr:translation initiation factor 1 [Cyclanthera pedata]